MMKNRVDASTPGHPHLPRQFIPYFLARRLARKYMKKMSPQARLPHRLRHSNHHSSPPRLKLIKSNCSIIFYINNQ